MRLLNAVGHEYCILSSCAGRPAVVYVDLDAKPHEGGRAVPVLRTDFFYCNSHIVYGSGRPVPESEDKFFMKSTGGQYKILELTGIRV